MNAGAKALADKYRGASARGAKWQIDAGCPSCGGEVEVVDEPTEHKTLRCIWCGEAWLSWSGEPAPEYRTKPRRR